VLAADDQKASQRSVFCATVLQGKLQPTPSRWIVCANFSFDKQQREVFFF
jgi:hypothetical protein